MANKLLTIFQNLDNAITGNWDSNTVVGGGSNSSAPITNTQTYDYGNGGDVIYTAKDVEDYNKTKLELQQNAYLNSRWKKANVDLSVKAFSGLNNIKLMYRDADLMDSFPEIGAALDIVSEESTITGSNGSVINVYSKSERIKNVLEDLFVNRLDLNITAPMIIRAMCKYGNQFMLLNIDVNNGVCGWRQLPVFDVERLENGIENQYGINASRVENKDMSTKFVWMNENNSQIPFRNWQIGHFRLLTNSLYLPYGCSYLNPARRHWRMLSLMEDMMLIYRLERSIERRVYKVFVGAIDDADVKAYVEDIANNFKRTPIIDPMTGQIDLRKNILPVRKDTPIPLVDGRTITIEELAKEFQEGKENYVYSVQDKTLDIVNGKVIWCGKNYTADKLYKIVLCDGTYSVMAGEHELIMSDGSKKRADELHEGDLIMPFKNANKATVKEVEIVDGDDVYCMTVVGSNGEDDRHNFAIRNFNSDGSWCDKGIFVSNCVDQDIFIPTRSENAPTPIDTLQAAQNLTAMDDIKFVQNKVLTALRIPKTFLNFEDATGDGKNLALMDVRFTRTINRIQQAFLMELTKIASIHLYLLGFDDELTNFSLSMNNPSTQAEQLEIDNIVKKIGAIRDAVADPGNGIPIMSTTRALKEIMKWSDNDIKNNLEEIRLERAIAAELEKTTQIIKKTGVFDIVDKMYGEPGAEYLDDQQMQQGNDGLGGGSMGGGSIGGGPVGGGLPPDMGDDGNKQDDEINELGSVGSDNNGEIKGNEGEIPFDKGGEQEKPMPKMEHIVRKNKPLITENNIFLNRVNSKEKNIYQRANILDKNFLINEEFNNLIKSLDDLKE